MALTLEDPEDEEGAALGADRVEARVVAALEDAVQEVASQLEPRCAHQARQHRLPCSDRGRMVEEREDGEDHKVGAASEVGHLVDV